MVGTRGRKPSFSRKRFEATRNILAQSSGISAIAQETGLTRQTIYRIRDNAAGCEAALASWGL
jgi:hypothetical protein